MRKKSPGKVIFKWGNLVQVYRSDLDFTFKTKRKLTPRWSAPFCIKSRKWNTYKLITINRSNVKGEFSARRLRRFHPRDGTTLVADQEQYMSML